MKTLTWFWGRFLGAQQRKREGDSQIQMKGKENSRIVKIYFKLPSNERSFPIYFLSSIQQKKIKYYKMEVIKTVWLWCKDRNEENKIFVYDNGGISHQWEKTDYSINVEAFEKSKVKFIIHYIHTKIWYIWAQLNLKNDSKVLGDIIPKQIMNVNVRVH